MSNVGVARGVMEKVTGIAKDRLLPDVRASAVLEVVPRRARRRAVGRQPTRAPVALFPTCLVEYQDPSIGKALVGVYERNRIACELPEGQVCCGMPWLDAGDVDKFRERGASTTSPCSRRTVRAGNDIVVPQPTCAYVLKNEYPDFLGTDDARLVAEHTFDTSEYLLARHREAPLDTEFDGTTYDSILWQAACHYRAQQIGPEEQAAHGAHRRRGHHGRAVLRDRRHLGAAGREPRDGAAGREAADGAVPRVRRPSSSRATATSPTPRSRKPPTRRRRTRCR